MLSFFNNSSKNHAKVYLILISMFLFSIIYIIVPDDEFSGVNNISELIKSELLKQKVLKDIKVNTGSLEGFNNSFNENQTTIYKSSSSTLEKDVEKIEEKVDDEYTPKNVKKSIYEQYFSRVYFSIITGCLLGYGDVYPITMKSKLLAMLQALMTIIIIVL